MILINTDDVHDENLLQKMDDFDYDEGDKFMEDSIKEAEAEEKAKKQKGTSSPSMEMQSEIKKLEDESSTHKEQ
jgi:hypothetical protein